MMELMQGLKGYSGDSREEEEEEEEIIAITGEESRLQLEKLQQQQQEEDVGNEQQQEEEEEEVDMMELRLGGSKSKCREEEEEEEEEIVVEKEHMFDKVVTPSDVGKLNRLVIPKQHAEKYFPLDSSSNEKGLLLNFEDRNGKMWRFRYSYWNSSQSYVMTKGWSRFVKEKKLEAGDIVSFHRGRAQLYRHRLYIDWRPRSNSHSHSHSHSHYHHPLLPPNYQYQYQYQYPYPNSNTSLITVPFYLPPHHYSSSSRSLYSSHPPPNYATLPTNYQHLNNTNNFYTLQPQPHRNQYPAPAPPDQFYYLTSPSTTGQQQGNNNNNMIIDSVPVAHHHRGGGNTGGKRLRLFGVNMECGASSSSSSAAAHVSTTTMSGSGDERGETSVLFDLDPSNSQYRHQRN